MAPSNNQPAPPDWKSDRKNDWKIFRGEGELTDRLLTLPAPPPWRLPRGLNQLEWPGQLGTAEQNRARPFLPSREMILAVNAALYLRRPLLITGKPGTGKSTLISKVAHELNLGKVIRWPITSRSTVKSGIYEYDAVGRLQASRNQDLPVEQFLKLGPLGTALAADKWPRALLIDEIDKSDLDFANDLLNAIEEGEAEIPELKRLKRPEPVVVEDALGNAAKITDGMIHCGQFPFVVMTSNGEREFPAPFLRRCVRLKIEPPNEARLSEIVKSQLKQYVGKMKSDDVKALIQQFDGRQKENREVSTDQLLNAIFLTVAMRDAADRTFSEEELAELREDLLRQLSGPEA